MATCCEFTGSALVGDTAAVITVYSGSGGSVSGITIYAEGCDFAGSNCGYSDIYTPDTYCDPTEGGAFPDAMVTDFAFTINDMPPDSILTIDSAEQSVTLTDNTGAVDQSQADVLEWNGLFEWITAAHNGCQRLCIDASGATLNPDTDISISTYDREL